MIDCFVNFGTAETSCQHSTDYILSSQVDMVNLLANKHAPSSYRAALVFIWNHVSGNLAGKISRYTHLYLLFWSAPTCEENISLCSC